MKKVLIAIVSILVLFLLVASTVLAHYGANALNRTIPASTQSNATYSPHHEEHVTAANPNDQMQPAPQVPVDPQAPASGDSSTDNSVAPDPGNGQCYESCAENGYGHGAGHCGGGGHGRHCGQ